MAKTYKFNEQNQKVWEKFYTKKLKAGKAKGTIAQYKVSLPVLEALCGNFSEATPEDIERVMEVKPDKKIHFKNFLTDVAIEGWVEFSNETLLCLMGEKARKLAELLK